MSVIKSYIGQIAADLKVWTEVGLIKECNGPIEHKNRIEWPNYIHGLGFTGNYDSIYNNMIDKRQFTCLLNDDSIFQYYLQISGKNTPVEGKVAFYPNPSLSNNSIHIDFSPGQFVPGIHPQTHMQHSTMSEIRFMMRHFPRLELFMEYIIRNLYWDFWKKRFPQAARLIDEYKNAPLPGEVHLKNDPSAMQKTELKRYFDNIRLCGMTGMVEDSWIDHVSFHIDTKLI